MTSSELRHWHRQQVATLLAKSEQHKRKAGAYAARAIVAFVLWATVHAGFWVGAAFFTAAVVCGALAMWNAEEWNIARVQSRVEL